MPVHAREFRESDIEEIDKIFKKQSDLGIPGLKNTIKNCTFVNTATENTANSEKVVGYGVLHNNGFVDNFPEATLIIDKNLRLLDKGRAVRSGIEIGIEACKEVGLENLFIIVDEKRYPGYVQILKRHFHATKVPGTLLMIPVK